MDQVMYYIAAPFWHESEQVRNERRNQVIAYSMMLTRRGILNYSPLLYTERFKKNCGAGAVLAESWLTYGGCL